MDTKPTLGLIGLGIMGRPMARNLLARRLRPGRPRREPGGRR